MILLLMAVREWPRRFWVIAFSSLVGLFIFVLGCWQELREAMPNIPGGSPIGDMFGIVNVPLLVAELPWPTLRASAIARLLSTLCLAMGVIISAYRVAARRDFAANLARLSEDQSVWLVIGCLVVGGCYFLGQSAATVASICCPC